MIPKKYIIVGLYEEKSKLALNCVASLAKYCPDYEIIQWTKDNLMQPVINIAKMLIKIKNMV